MISFDKFKGCLYGVAVGDALGYPNEFKKHTSIVTDMIQREGKSYLPGTWTDDTSMTICLAESILEKGKLDPNDQLNKYSNWLNNGWMSCVDDLSFGSGKATRIAIDAYNQTGSIENGDDTTLGNGSVMRIAPVPMLFINESPKTVGYLCSDSSKTTHNNKECCYECARLGIVLYYLLKESKCKISHVSNLLPGMKYPVPTEKDGKATTTVNNAFWSIMTNHDFESSLIAAVNLEGDADSVGAVTGAIAGAMYGYSAIPDRWLDQLQKKEIIENLIIRMWNFVNERINK